VIHDAADAVTSQPKFAIFLKLSDLVSHADCVSGMTCSNLLMVKLQSQRDRLWRSADVYELTLANQGLGEPE